MNNAKKAIRRTLLLVTCALALFAAPAQGVITYVASSSNPGDPGSVGAATVTIAFPAGIQAGDLLLIVASHREAGRTMTMNAAGGQTWAALTANTTTVSQRYLWARYTGTGTSASVNFSDTTTTTVSMHAFRPTQAVNTWAVDAGPVNGTFAAPTGLDNVSIPGITTVTDGAVAVATWATADDNTWQVQTGGWSHMDENQYRNTAGGDASQSSVYQVRPSDGATGAVVNRQLTLGGDAGNYSIVAFREVFPTVTLGNGAAVANASLAPGGAITDLDAFTFTVGAGTASVTGLTVTLTGTNSFQGLSEVRITDNAGTTTYFAAAANPASNTVVFSGGTPIPVTTAATTFRIRITPKTHANMPVPPGATYAVGGTVTAFSTVNPHPQAGTDTNSATVTIDNLSPNSATAVSGTAGVQSVTLNWTTSNSADFSRSVVLRWTGAAGAQVPAEGTDYAVGNTIGTATVVCVRTADAASTAVNGVDGGGGNCSATALANGTQYSYRVFQKDANGNYDVGAAMGSFTTAALITLGDGVDPVDFAVVPGGTIADLDAFTFTISAGTANVTALTVTLTGLNSFQGLSEVRITNNAGTTTYFAAVTNPASNTVAFSAGTPIPVTTTPTSFKIRITPKTHANMPVPPGATYAVGGTVTAFTSTAAQTGADSNSATATIDNLSPDGATATSTVTGDTQATLNWTTSAASDFSRSVVLRWTGAAGAQVPAEGTDYVIGNTIGTATVVCVRTADAASTPVSGTDGAGTGGCSATPLVNGTSYSYRVFQKDANGNYDVGTSFGSVTPIVRPTLVSASLSCGSLTTLEVVFSRPLTAATAQNIANYALNNGGTISAAVLGADTRVVTLTVGNILAGASYTLTVNNVTDSGGNAILAGSTISFFSESGYINGLKGTYYSQNGSQGAAFAFTGTAVDRIDSQVNFDWVNAAPGVAGIGADGFSVRWQGYVTVPVTGSYTFRTRSDDGVRLSVGGTQIINNWTDHSAAVDNASPVALTAGQYYAITMEYFENGGQAVAELWWSGPSTGGFEFIPAANLWRCGGSSAPSAIYKMDESSWNGTAGEVQDSGPSALHGTASGLSGSEPSTSGATPALTGTPGTCNYGVFNRANKHFIALPAGFPNLGASGSFTVTAWIRTTDRTLTGQRILIDDQTEAGGWGLSLGDGGAGMVRLYSRGSSTQTLDTGAVIGNNTWYFIAASISVGANTVATLYVYDTSGALVNTTNATWTGFTWGTDAGPASIGGETNGSGAESTSNFGFSGNIDEVRVYGQALTQADIAGILGQRRPCISSLSHYAITFPNGVSGVTCEATDVLITAHDASEAAVAPTAGTVIGLTTSTGTGAWLSPAVFGGGGWSVSGLSNGIAQYTWPGAETSFRVRLRHNTVTPSLTVVPAGGVGAVENSAISFADTAFRVTANGTSSASVGTHISGKDTNVGFGNQTLYLQAIRTDTSTGSCAGLIPGQTINVEMAASRDNPAAGSSQVSVRNSGGGMTAVSTGAGTPGAYGNVSLAFDAQSKAPLVINYPDAGTVSLNVRYTLPGPPTPVYLSGATGSFVVRPFGFRVSGPTSAGSPSSSSPVFIKAGASFNTTLTAVQWKSGDDVDADGIPDSNAQIAGNAATPNFGLEAVPASATLTHALNAPSGGSAGSLGGTTSFTAFSSGAKTQAVSWSEVGFIDLKAASTNYLGSGQDVSSSIAGLTGVGRFYPDHFSLASSPAPALVNRSASACTPASSFTYMNEGLLISFALEARNTANSVTQNYRTANGYAKLNPATIAQLGFGARSGATVLTPRLDLSAGSSGTFTNGVAAVSALIAVQRAAAPDGPHASVQIGIAPAEAGGDGVVMDSFDLDADGTAGNERRNLGVTTEVRFGRLRLQSRAASSIVNMRVPLQVQYYNGTGFVRSTDDSCTALAASTFALSDYRVNLNACETAATAGVTFAGGDATLVLAKPGGANNGSLVLTANLGTASGSYCPSVGASQAAAASAIRPYLQGAWSGSGWNVDPTARIGFGVYGGQPRNIIFMRENY